MADDLLGKLKEIVSRTRTRAHEYERLYGKDIRVAKLLYDDADAIWTARQDLIDFGIYSES